MRDEWGHWSPGPEQPILEHGEVHVWWAQLDEVGGPAASSVLSPAEQDRAERILPPARRRRWVDSRMLLRAVLGRYLGLEPRRVELARGAHGKPRLIPDVAGRDGRARTQRPLPAAIDFSISHSRGGALLAIARDRRVGVDLELLRAVPKAPSLARRALGAEHARELDGPPPSAAGRRLPAPVDAVRGRAEVRGYGPARA